MSDTGTDDQAPMHDISEAIVLDFDRTLGNYTACMQRLYDVIGHFNGIDVDEIEMRKAAFERDGGSFDPLTPIKEVLNPEAYEAFCDEFVRAEGPSLLYEDSLRFLNVLEQAKIPHIILTYGSNFDWQRLKLAATGQKVGFSLMTHPDKALVVRGMRAEDDAFHFAVVAGNQANYRARTIALIDDKSVAFRGLPEDCGGFKVRRTEELPAQRGEVPDRVKIIASFDELTVNEHGQLQIGSGDVAVPSHDHATIYASIRGKHHLEQEW
jgi:phosphoglycolate phosphatase-like HAD superfamily hydrolase